MDASNEQYATFLMVGKVIAHHFPRHFAYHCGLHEPGAGAKCAQRHRANEGGLCVQQRFAAMVAMMVVALSGCQSMKDAGTSMFGGTTGPAVGGLLTPLGGSAVEGSVGFQPRDGAVTMVVHVTGMGPGVYRVAIHATGNCSSRNGFSAGAPWAPPDKSPVVVSVATNSEGTATLSTRIAGVTVDGPDGILGKSVVIHDGAVGPLDAQPGVPNRRIACTVIGAAPSIFH